MALSNLLGTDLDQISRSIYKIRQIQVLLFDTRADDISDIVLRRTTAPHLDITPFVATCNITQSHDTEANQASLSVITGRSLTGACFSTRGL
jgi:hypothetical protein